MTTPIQPYRFGRPADCGLHAHRVQLTARPLVSVIMTSFNSQPWIERALRSLQEQTWTQLEIILVDDASTDGTVALAREIAQGDERIRILALPDNAGTYSAKNEGLALAKGVVLTFMDSDDVSHPERVERQLDALRKRDLVATTCNFERRSTTGELLMNRGLPARQGLITLMIKRQVVDEVGWFDPVRTSADDEYFERIRHVYGRTAHANVMAPLYFALHRENSLSTSVGNSVSLQEGAGDHGDGLTDARRDYVRSYRAWYSALADHSMRPYYPRDSRGLRPFEALPPILGIPDKDDV